MKKPLHIFLYCILLSSAFLLQSCHSHKKNISNTKVADNNQVTSSSIVAGLLGVNEKEIKTKKLYRFVSEWYGVPYKYGGCDKSGTDCSCLTDNLYSSVYERKLPRSATDMAKNCDRINESSVKEGDLIFFKINSKDVSHVGVILRNNKFVHASTSRGVIISDINETYYKKYFYCFGKYKG